ncbi:DUF1345 domain-containing protein [Sphingobacterium faecium]|uniref:DUF1345 domain-containing protein n=1 Tax=Sphingobacterium faecium TaxID=34087 RepID=UPI00246895E4|nr:DUF1345 domain-containing protein [Sphingobacterium faecium]MDH5826360.1 DUF1345 domain-containing protein [Sphingobacterium faecium]
MKLKNKIQDFTPIQKSLISFTISLVTVAISSWYGINLIMTTLLFWITFCMSYSALSWYIFYQMPVTQIIKKAASEDGSRLFVTIFILLASFTCLFAVLLIIIADTRTDMSKGLSIGICVMSIISSWFLVHTTYVFHYAHLFYAEGSPGKGLDFPGSEKPDYVDFAYFSFVLGCTFQVSDVEVSSRKIRRVVLFHGLLAFALNTFVVALTINIISGLIH